MLKLSKLLMAMAMGDLRDLAADLEPLVDRELRAVKKKDLAKLVEEALDEIESEDAETFGAILQAHGLRESTESDSPAGADESTETEDEVESVDAADAADADPDGAEEAGEVPPESPYAIPEIPYAIQVREHSSRFPYKYGEIVLSPSRELVEGVVHAKLNQDGVKRLVARGTRVRKMK